MSPGVGSGWTVAQCFLCRETCCVMNEIVIRRVGLEDMDALQTISRQTFEETFAEGNSPENMAKYLEERLNSDILKTELSNHGSRFYFAEFNGEVIGYLKVNTGSAQTEYWDGAAVEIERIYVLHEFHGKKVGQVLYDKAIAIAHELHTDTVWLGVWEKNPRAINFYKKNGFVEFDKHIFRLGDDEQTDIMMKRSLCDP